MNKDKELQLAVGDFVVPTIDVDVDYSEPIANVVLYKTITIGCGEPLLITNIEHSVEHKDQVGSAFYTVLSIVRMTNQQMLSMWVSEDTEQINQFHGVFKRVVPYG